MFPVHQVPVSVHCPTMASKCPAMARKCPVMAAEWSSSIAVIVAVLDANTIDNI